MPRLPLTEHQRRYGQALCAELRAARVKTYASAQQAAERAGLSVDTVRSIEAQRVPSPSFQTVAALAHAVGLRLDALAAKAQRAGRTRR